MEIINAISNSALVLLVFSETSNKSHYVLREVNSAVSRNKTIIPFRIQDVLPSDAMEFYLGPAHWLDAFPEILDIHLDKITRIIDKLKAPEKKAKEKAPIIVGPQLIKLNEISKLGLTYRDVTMKEIELDYLCVPSDKYVINDEIEGTVDDWKECAAEFEVDTSILLVKNDQIIGYCDMYPVIKDAYSELINGQKMIRDSMIDVFSIGGEFPLYIAMVAIDPKESNQSNYLMMLDWIINHIAEWKKEDILISNIGISVYSGLLEKFIIRFGFQYKGTNPANGKIYETSVEELKKNPAIIKRFPGLL